MRLFRVVALGYAASVLLIVPSWLSADDQVDPVSQSEPEAVTVVEQPAEAEVAPAPEPVAPSDEGAAPEAEPEPAQAEFVESEPEPKARPAKEPSAAVSASASVTITDFEFAPASITVNVGDTVTWTNEGPTQHSATANDGSFDTGIMGRGESGSHTFTEAGTIAYICTPHPFMKGTVVVQGGSAGTGGGGSGDDGGGGATDGTDTAASPDTTVDDGSGLPATGGETLLIALLGLATLASGLLLRRRAEG